VDFSRSRAGFRGMRVWEQLSLVSASASGNDRVITAGRETAPMSMLSGWVCIVFVVSPEGGRLQKSSAEAGQFPSARKPLTPAPSKRGSRAQESGSSIGVDLIKAFRTRPWRANHARGKYDRLSFSPKASVHKEQRCSSNVNVESLFAAIARVSLLRRVVRGLA